MGPVVGAHRDRDIPTVRWPDLSEKNDIIPILDLPAGHGLRQGSLLEHAGAARPFGISMTLLPGLASGRIRGDFMACQGTVALNLIDFGAVARHLGRFVCRGRRRRLPLG